jgi:N-acetylneuraminic acid mutarotase
MLNRRQLVGAGLALPLLHQGQILAKWLTKPDLPYPVQEIYPTVHNNQIVVAGGIYQQPDGKLGIAKTVLAFDLQTERWQALPDLPEPRHHPMLASVEGKLYAISGFTTTENGNWSASTDVLWLDEKQQKWHKLSAAQMPFPMCETVAMVAGSDIHLATGRRPAGKANTQWRDQTDINHHLIFNSQSQTWREGMPAPTARNSAAAAVVDNNWYVIGGRTVDEGNKAMTEVYDPELKRWFSRRPMPQAQGGLAAASLGKDIFVFGGEYFDQGGGVYQEVWRYETERDQWSQVDIMPVPRHGLGALTIGDAIYVIAGAEKAGGKDTSPRMSVYRP